MEKLVRPIYGYTPEVWVFKDEEGTEFSNKFLNVLISEVTLFRHNNDLPVIPYLKDVIVSYTLLSSKVHEGKYEEYEPNTKVKLSLEQYFKGAKLLASGLVTSSENIHVSKEVATKRAEVCVNCPHNRKVVNNKTKNDSSLAQSAFCKLAPKDSKTKYDNKLHICGLCTCKNSCKVNFKKDFIIKGTSEGLKNIMSKPILGKDDKSMQCWIYDDSIE